MLDLGKGRDMKSMTLAGHPPSGTHRLPREHIDTVSKPAFGLATRRTAPERAWFSTSDSSLGPTTFLGSSTNARLLEFNSNSHDIILVARRTPEGLNFQGVSERLGACRHAKDVDTASFRASADSVWAAISRAGSGSPA